MLIIIFLVLVLLVCFLFYKKNPSRKVFTLITVWIFIWFVLEVCVYGILLFRVHQGGNIFLIGNQLVLDHLIKDHLVNVTYEVRNQPGAYYELDSDLGWTLGPNKYSGKKLSTNNEGLRANHNYSFVPNHDQLRMAVFGDSFMFCDGEEFDDCWTNQLEQKMGNLEVLNFGISAYGLGQSYLRYLKDGIKFHPDILVINYLLPTERDGIYARDILAGAVPFSTAHLQRVIFHTNDHGELTHRTTHPLDWFNWNFREENIYKPLGLSQKKGFWASKVFAVSNIGVLIKSEVAPVYYSHKFGNDAYEKIDVKVNIAVLRNLLEITKEQKTEVLFIYKIKYDQLPEYIKQLFKQYEHITYVPVYYLMRQYALQKYGIKDRAQLMNNTAHFNALGNKIFAETMDEILKKKPWGIKPKREFFYNENINKFVNVTK